MKHDKWVRERGHRCRCNQQESDNWSWGFVVACPFEECLAEQGKPCKLVKGSCFRHDIHAVRWRALLTDDFARAMVLACTKRVTKRRRKPYQELVERHEI